MSITKSIKFFLDYQEFLSKNFRIFCNPFLQMLSLLKFLLLKRCGGSRNKLIGFLI